MKNTLYGDGIHDDAAAIQEMIDTSTHGLELPMPRDKYIISKPLELPSDFCLTLPRYAEIKLAAGSDCVMLKNKTVDDYKKRLGKHLRVGWFVNCYPPDFKCHNIKLFGGIWNFNNKEQTANPMQDPNADWSKNYSGLGILFYGVDGLHISDITLKDPVTFGLILDTVNDFTIENIIFDYNYGNPIAVNMDGVHIDGNCHRGVIKNLKGACYDDMVALNADEGSDGPISDIEIDGIYALDSHSAVRLLTVKHRLSNVHIRNVYGTYYQYCIGFTKYYEGETTGCFDSISIDHIYASKAFRRPEFEQHMHGWDFHFPLIYFTDGTKSDNITIDTVHRCESVNPIETICIDEKALVNRLSLRNITVENLTDKHIAKFLNRGIVKKLYVSEMESGDIENNGSIENLVL